MEQFITTSQNPHQTTPAAKRWSLKNSSKPHRSAWGRAECSLSLSWFLISSKIFHPSHQIPSKNTSQIKVSELLWLIIYFSSAQAAPFLHLPYNVLQHSRSSEDFLLAQARCALTVHHHRLASPAMWTSKKGREKVINFISHPLHIVLVTARASLLTMSPSFVSVRARTAEAKEDYDRTLLSKNSFLIIYLPVSSPARS